MQPEHDNSGKVPGFDPAPEDSIEKRVQVVWSFVGAFLSLSLLGVFLKRYGLAVLPEHPHSLDYARAGAFLVTVLNIGAWYYFPLGDLAIQRRWIHTAGALLPSGTAEFFAILLASVLLLATIVTSLVSPLALAVAGLGVYVWNFVGFAYIRTQLVGIIGQSHELYDREQEPRRSALVEGLNIVEGYFCCGPLMAAIRNRQQVRHILLAFSFLISIALAVIGTVAKENVFQVLSYVWSIITFLSAEVSIAVWRSRRDNALRAVKAKLRTATGAAR